MDTLKHASLLQSDNQAVSPTDSVVLDCEKEKYTTLLNVDTQPVTLGMDFTCHSISPCSTVSLKRTAEECPRGLIIKKTARSRSTRGGEFIDSDKLVSVTFPCHDSADYVLGYKPETSKKSGTKPGGKTPKAGVARGYSKGIYNESSDNNYNTVYFR